MDCRTRIAGAGAPAWANPELLPPALELGAKDCLFCHAEPAGGKNWNARGHWLLEQKQQRGAPKVSVAWLREYAPGEAPEAAAGAGGPLNIPETLHRGPFFRPNPDAAALKRWLASRGRYSTARRRMAAVCRRRRVGEVFPARPHRQRKRRPAGACLGLGRFRQLALHQARREKDRPADVSRRIQGHSVNDRRKALHSHQLQRRRGGRSRDGRDAMELRSGHGGLGAAGDFRLCHAGTVLLVGRKRRAAARLHGGQLSCRPGPRQRQAHPGFRR